MNEIITQVLEFKLFEVSEYSITVFDLVRITIYLLIGRVALWIIKKALTRKWKSKKIDDGGQHSLYQIIKYLVWIFVIVLALESIGVKVTILIAGSAALLVGVGLGLQQTFNDIVSGIILLVEGSIRVGDILEVGNIVVKVKKIGIRTSTVIDRNEIIIILPNSKIVNDQVINWSHNYALARFTLTVGVSYGTDVDKVYKILNKCAAEHPKVDDSKKPFARLVDFGDSSLDFELFFWSGEMFGIEQIKSDIRRSITKKFAEEGVVIPFPQRDLHFKSGSLKTD